MKRNIKLSVIVPTYNEAERIPPTLKSMTTYFSYQNYTYEIIVVDDGSTDEVCSVVKTYMKRDPYIRLESYKKNRGKGYAVRHGMRIARGDYRL